MRGQLFENAVVLEAPKYRFNRGLPSNLFYYSLCAIEIKAGSTVASDFFRNLRLVAQILPRIAGKAVVYGGDARQQRKVGEAVPSLPDLLISFSEIA